MASDGLMYIVNHLDVLYKGSLAVAKELEGEKAMFTGHRGHDENLIAYVSRRQVELARYKSALGESLPEVLKVKLLVKQAKLSAQQGHLLSTWFNGSRDFSTVIAALCRLDTEKEMLGLGLGVASGSKDFFESYEDGAEWPEESGGNWLTTPEQDELVCFYEDEAYDIGVDSDAEDYVWILATDLQSELDESVIEQQLASFAQVQKQKNELKKARGWFTPSSWSKGGGKAKGKKGLSTPGASWSTASSGMSGGFSKGSKGFSGKSGGKGKLNSMDSFSRARQGRDDRRTMHGIHRVSRTDLARLPPTSPSVAPSAQGGNSQQSYFMVPFQSGVHNLSSTFYAFSDLDQCSFMSVDTAMGVIDTGA
eukprot:4179440-Amphidinium_carterae.2